MGTGGANDDPMQLGSSIEQAGMNRWRSTAFRDTRLTRCGEAMVNTGRGILGGIITGGLLGIATGLSVVLP